MIVMMMIMMMMMVYSDKLVSKNKHLSGLVFLQVCLQLKCHLVTRARWRRHTFVGPYNSGSRILFSENTRVAWRETIYFYDVKIILTFPRLLLDLPDLDGASERQALAGTTLSHN